MFKNFTEKIRGIHSEINRSSRGFTLLEMLVVISIVVLLSSLLVIYSHTGENQIVLFKDQSQLITILNRAKSLSIDSLQSSQPSCGFGVHFSKADNSFVIFRDLGADCQNADHVYTDAGEIFESYKLSPNINFQSITFTDIIFIPPDPTTLIDNNPNINDGTIILQSLDGSTSLKVKVNNFGQITTN